MPKHYLLTPMPDVRHSAECAVAIHKIRTTYDPQSLKAIGRAFDEAWIEIAGNFGDDPADIRAGRLKLAQALLTTRRRRQRRCGSAEAGGTEAVGQRVPEAAAALAPSIAAHAVVDCQWRSSRTATRALPVGSAARGLVLEQHVADGDEMAAAVGAQPVCARPHGSTIAPCPRR